MLLDEVNGMRGNRVGNVFILPKRFASAFHITDSTYTVNDGHIVAVT